MYDFIYAFHAVNYIHIYYFTALLHISSALSFYDFRLSDEINLSFLYALRFLPVLISLIQNDDII